MKAPCSWSHLTICCWVTLVGSDSVRPHRWQPTRLPHPWGSLGKNTGVGCHFFLQCMKGKSESEVAQSCPTQRPHGLQPTRLLRPWDFPGKSTGVGRHYLLWGMPYPFLNLWFWRVNQNKLSSQCTLGEGVQINQPWGVVWKKWKESFNLFNHRPKAIIEASVSM